MNFLKFFLLIALVAASSAFNKIRDNRLRAEVQQTYYKCNAGFLSWNHPRCRNLVRILATLKF